VPRALSDSVPCRDYSMGRLVPLAGKGVTPTLSIHTEDIGTVGPIQIVNAYGRGGVGL
jgi:hypothetical protein